MSDEQAQIDVGSAAGPVESNPPAPAPGACGLAEGVEAPRHRLEECEGRYDELLEAFTDLVFVMTPDGRLAFVNRSWQQHLGYAGEEVLGQSVLDRVQPECQPTCRTALQLAAAGRPVENLEFRAVAKDGGRLDVLARLTPRRDARGQVVQILGSARDVTELRLVQERLRSSEERLHLLFEYAPDAYYLNDLMGTFLDMNKATEALCGYPREELLGKSFLRLNLFPPKQLPRAAGYLAKNALGHPVGPVEFRLTRKDGTHTHIEVRTYPVRIGNKNVVLGIARDISDRRKAEGVLRESEEKFKVIFEEAQEGIIYLNESGCVLDANKKALEILGQSADRIVGTHFIETGILASEDVLRFPGLFQQVLLGTQTPFELSITNQQGRKLHLECSASLVRRKGGSKGLVFMVRDVTERKQAEALLEALNRDLKATINDLERSNQDLRDFAHVAAHDLKAPLRGIANLAEWIVQDCADKIDEQGRDNLILLQQRVSRMTLLIDGILRYAEIGHDDQGVEMIDTQVLVAEVVEQIAPPQHIAIRVAGPLPVVSCERTALTQVFQNLLSNAVKYMDKSAGEIRVAATPAENGWTFRVADNGPGIPAEHFDRIFQMFQTLTPSHRSDSTGIGLAIVKKIVQMHGGNVWVESQPGAGSTFLFTLPQPNERTTHEKQ